MPRPRDLTEFSLVETPLDDGGVLLAVAGELDIATVPALRDRLATITATRPRRVVLDLHEVSFLDSTALAVFVRAQRELGDGCSLTLVIPGDSYARLILEVAGLAGTLDVVETLDAG